MDTVVSNFEKVCRICMKIDQTFLSITSFKIIDMIIECASVKIWENDDLPNQICFTCFLQLQNAIDFKHLCVNSDNKFRKIIQQNEFNLLNNESDINTVKDELFEDNDDDGFLMDIKEEDIENSFENEKMKIVNDEHYSKKSETNNILEIKIKDRSDLNKLQILSKSEDRNDTYEDIKHNEKVIKTFTCNKCRKEFKKLWVLGQHMHRKHRAKALKCNKCEFKCYHLLHLKEHQELTHNPLNLTCSICNKVFKDIYRLNDHNKLMHSSKTLQCKRCEMSFNDKQTLKCHIKEVHSDEKHVPCHICGKSILKKNLSIHFVIHKERAKINCDLCSKTFLRQESLKLHIRHVHENQIRKRNFLCNICGHASQSAAKLRTHLFIHSNEKPYACEHCDKKYRTADNLKRHISNAHLNQRKFKCTFCPQAFFERRTFVHHVRRHTGEKPHKCEICGKEFIQKYSLKIHMKMHTNSKDNFTQN